VSNVSGPDPSPLGPPPHLGTTEPPDGGDKASFATRYALAQKAGGIVVPLLTVFLAFLIGGVVVLITTGSNPISTYKAIFEGAGLNWFTEVGSHEIRVPLTDAHVWFPWNVDDIESTAAFNLQQTLINFVPLVLTGLAVGFAFRCGMFNIGGQGQYLGGAIMAVWIGSELPGLPSVVHVLFAVIAGALVGAAWAGIAGFLKATVGTHEVISTIMLNWIAIWIGVFLFGLGGPLQNDTQPFVPVSNDVVEGAKLPIFWGDPFLQALHVGFFVALAALVVYWITLNRTTLGYEVRAVGYNPEAARYGGISVARNYFLAMAISGGFAGLAGAIDTVGWAYRINTNDVLISSQIAFVGIAVALLGRNKAIGIGLSALLFASLVTGTSTRNLDPEIFRPELASNLTVMIQGLVVLFVGADVLILSLFGLRKRRRRQRAEAAPAE
jgi:general nucleoside transport system permease protein